MVPHRDLRACSAAVVLALLMLLAPAATAAAAPPAPAPASVAPPAPAPAPAAPPAPAATAAAAPSAPAPASARLRLTLPLRADEAGLVALARAVSTPGSPEYGRYQPPAVLSERFGAPVMSRLAVATWLRRAGASRVSISPTGLYVSADLPVRSAQHLFHVRLLQYRPPRLASYIAPAPRASAAAAGTGGPTVPRAIARLVSGVVGLNTRPLVLGPRASSRSFMRRRFPHPDAARAAGRQPASGYVPVSGTPLGCSAALMAGGFSPNQYLTAYGIDPLHAAGLRGQGVRAAVIEIDGFRRSDLARFASCFHLRLPPTRVFPITSLRPLAPGGESTLDLEVLDAVAPGLRELQVYEASASTTALVDAFVAPLVVPRNRPQVLSISLGLCEEQLRQDGAAGIRLLEGALAESAAAGITVIASSGDEGSSACRVGGRIQDRAAVDFPASSPFVTGVGGTNIRLNPDNTLKATIAWNDTYIQSGAGGGGESGLFAAPSWQQGLSVVREAGGPAHPLRRRAVPDVSMLADLAPGYSIYCTAARDGCSGWQTVGGTSAAAPLLAGSVALIDQDLHRHSRELLGQLNPLIYSVASDLTLNAQTFDDVSQINNDLGPYLRPGSRSVHCCAAGPGFDEATGWGSLNVSAFDTVALARLPVVADVFLTIPAGQHPARAGGIVARIGCSRSCLGGVFGFLTAGSRSIDLRSARVSFRRRGGRSVRIAFTPAQLRVIRRALATGRRVDGLLYGYDLDPHHRLATFTSGSAFAIRN